MKIQDKAKIKVEKTKQAILKIIPKGNISEQKMIKSFELIDKLSRKSQYVDLFDLARFLYKMKDKDFEKLNNYFKKVHKIIRKQAVKSKYFNENLEIVVLNNYRDNTGFYFGKKDAVKRYNKVLDDYDPNKKQNKRTGYFNWSGFWSLISTKNGKITGCYLGDTYDREIFYKGMKQCNS